MPGKIFAWPVTGDAFSAQEISLKRILKMVLLIAACLVWLPARAEDTGKVINNRCRANLKMLNEAVAKFLAENDSGLPSWANYETVALSLIDRKYFAGKLEAPTRDCKYNLVAVSRNDYQWYCDLHGVLDGENSVTFMYHEHRLTGKTTKRYENIERYKQHTKDLLRWTEYQQTPGEKFKFHYNSNPLTTIILSILGVLIIIFIYRNVT